jgi:hypothetical protein
VLPGDAFCSSLLHAANGSIATAPTTTAAFTYPLIVTKHSSFAVYCLGD